MWLTRDRPPEVLAERLRSGRWERTAHGIYTASGEPEELPFEAKQRRALANIAGTHRRLTGAHWFSHASAAMVWGIPVLSIPTTTHVLASWRAGSTRTASLSSHTGRLEDADLTEVAGVPVTTLARTVADCLATLSPASGLVIADGALHRGLAMADLEAAVRARTARNGSARARAVLEIADDGSESPGESVSRFVLLRDGLPVPSTQIEVPTRLGTFWSDLGWEEWMLLMEYDGRLKYMSQADLVSEKRRHDALVETGRRVLRVTGDDVRGLTRRVVPFLPASVQRSLRPRRLLRG